MRKSLFYSVLLLLLLGNVSELKAAAVPAEEFFKPSEEIVTPHIKWLKPYYSGKIKVLFITYRSGVREMIEIAQRIDLDYEVFAYARPMNSSGKTDVIPLLGLLSQRKKRDWKNSLLRTMN